MYAVFKHGLVRSAVCFPGGLSPWWSDSSRRLQRRSSQR